MTRIERFHHLSLTVSDLNRSSGWYQKVLGLEKVAEFEGDGFRRIRLVSPGGLVLSLTQHDGGSSDRFDERRTGMDHVAFEVGAGDVETFKRRFEELAVDHSDIETSAGGPPMITFRDPDNIQLEVFGPARAET